MTLDLPWPPSTNTAYATVNGRRVKTKAARAYSEYVRLRAAVSSEARMLRHQVSVATAAGDDHPRLAVTIDAYPPDRRRRDLANLEKLAIDAVFNFLGLDDSVIDELHLIRRDIDRPDGRITLEIREASQ